MNDLRDNLEKHQILIYFVTIITAAAIAFLTPRSSVLTAAINPALALMLFVTFLQVPLIDLGRSFTKIRFLSALLVANFFIVPVLVGVLLQFIHLEPMIKLGVLFVLMTPCIDYVVTFSHIRQADSKLLLAYTPILLMIQMLLLPFYLYIFLNAESAKLVHIEPFIHAFLWLIIIPLLMAALVQFWAARKVVGKQVMTALCLLPVLAAALVLFIVVAAMVPRLGSTSETIFQVAPLYVIFATVSPILGWMVSRLFSLDNLSGRAAAFSTGTRNSLVVLPLALTVPGAIPVLPSVIVVQTMIELVSSVFYMRLIPKLKF
ncbi:Sodium Bile acid symporter family [Legionella beliardensis]|uniref:Sodium Bile acid symporter family n=1 Tax=Legionella beliardensis TaxID=91822 RepID=A0A378JT27_9GAMM|nr:arsenic resistance protein [Legionella beliardensis]STX55729.1 Sodium Bile acid symporter family [Legionella beliardensis]